MLQLNTINKLIIVLSLCTLLPIGLFAQSEETIEENTIVMSKSELDSFLSTIAEARRSQLKARESKRLKQDLAELRLNYNERSEIGTRYDNISNQQIFRELRYLNQRIDNLSSNNNGLPSMGKDNSTVIMPSNSNPNPVYPRNDRNTTSIVPANNNDNIKELQNKIDSLQNIVKLKGLRQQMDSLELNMTNADNAAEAEVSTEKKPYFKQSVYFGNNSATLNATFLPYIQNLTQILVKYPETKVFLVGWASPVGNTSYNKQLSMRRAEAVEQAFINNGIDASLILTSFKGEDKSSSEQHARRVDMSIIVM